MPSFLAQIGGRPILGSSYDGRGQLVGSAISLRDRCAIVRTCGFAKSQALNDDLLRRPKSMLSPGAVMLVTSFCLLLGYRSIKGQFEKLCRMHNSPPKRARVVMWLSGCVESDPAGGPP